MSEEQILFWKKAMFPEIEEKDKEIERLNNKVEELMTLYTTEREVKEDYKSIIKEVREYIEKELSGYAPRDFRDLVDGYSVLEILDKGE